MRHFTVYGECVGKQRCGINAFVGKGGKKIVHEYTRHKTVQYENLVRLSYEKAFPGEPLYPASVPLWAYVRVFKPIPKSFSCKKRKMAISGALHPLTKPDVDNIEKSVFDALNEVCFEDDRAIVRSGVEKRFAEVPRAEVWIGTMDEERKWDE